MKRRHLVLSTLLTLLLAGIVLVQTGWFDDHPPPHPDRPPHVIPIQAVPNDRLTTEAIQRWRTGQPRHWRACLLQQ
ncbi:MAG TPA: hypothetical protein VNK04_25650 [Gemmataceae bacterium]|nr:hypothetical protein [Gemmataceae bacterium]